MIFLVPSLQITQYLWIVLYSECRKWKSISCLQNKQKRTNQLTVDCSEIRVCFKSIDKFWCTSTRQVKEILVKSGFLIDPPLFEADFSEGGSMGCYSPDTFSVFEFWLMKLTNKKTVETWAIWVDKEADTLRNKRDEYHTDKFEKFASEPITLSALL